MTDYYAAAQRLEESERETQEVLSSLDEVEAAINEVQDLIQDAKNGKASKVDVGAKADYYYGNYGSEHGLITNLSGKIETLAGPAEELQSTLDTTDLSNTLRSAFSHFEEVSGAFSYATNVDVSSNQVSLSDVEQRIDEAEEMLSEVRAELETAQTLFPEKNRETQETLRDAQREKEIEMAERTMDSMREHRED